MAIITNNITGSLQGNITGSLFGTASFASRAFSSSFAASSSFPIALVGTTIYNPFQTSNVNVTNGVILGRAAGNNASGAFDANFIGRNAGSSATNANFSVFVGTNAGALAANANNSIFVGQNSGLSATNANNSVFIGALAGSSATNANNSIFIGPSAGRVAVSASNSNFIGNNAGDSAVSASNSNFVGTNAGQNAVSASYSTLVGFQAGYYGTADSGTLGIKSNNIIIGTNITLPGGTQDSINIGGIIFGTGSYSTTSGIPFSGSVNGRVGVNQVLPSFNLDVSGSGRFTDGLQVTGSLVASSIVGELSGTASFASTASFVRTAQTASYVLDAVSSSFASTASFIQNAQTASFVLQSISSSFATTASSVNILIQNVVITGSLRVSGSITGSLFGTASWSSNAVTASFVQNAQTASYVLNAVTASYVLQSVSASFASTASFVNTLNQNVILTGSLRVSGSVSGSLFGTASWSSNAVTASFVQNAQTASYVLNAVSTSFASTASSLNTLNQPVNISGSFAIITGSGIEFQVLDTGVKIGNVITDRHTATGSFSVSGSVTASLFGTASQAVSASVADTLTATSGSGLWMWSLGNPTGSGYTLSGNALYSASADIGVLLTTASNAQEGALYRAISTSYFTSNDFIITTNLRSGGGNGADGIGIFAGANSVAAANKDGITVFLDEYNGGASGVDAIKIYNNGSLVVSLDPATYITGLLDNSKFRRWDMIVTGPSSGRTLTLLADDIFIWRGSVGAWTPSGANYGVWGLTGGFNNNHIVSMLNLYPAKVWRMSNGLL